jgi:hypothetical protein
LQHVSTAAFQIMPNLFKAGKTIVFNKTGSIILNVTTQHEVSILTDGTLNTLANNLIPLEIFVPLGMNTQLTQDFIIAAPNTALQPEPKFTIFFRVLL